MKTLRPTFRSIQLSLARAGWKLAQNINSDAELWIPTESARLLDGVKREFTAITLPTNPNNADFEILLHSAIANLKDTSAADIERILELSALKLEENYDELEVRRETEAQRGTISWEAGAEMVQGAQNLLIAAAKSTNEKKARYGQSQYVVADNFLDKCQMGQTRIGSFIVSALVPTDASIKTTNSEKARAANMPNLTGRNVTTQLTESLSAAFEGIRDFKKNSKVEVFDELVQDGVSYELLGGLLTATGKSHAQLSVEFLPTTEGYFNESATKRFEVTPGDHEAITKGKRHLEATPTKQYVTLIGEVIYLKSRESKPSDRLITLAARLQSSEFNFRVELDREQYDEAVTAHHERKMIEIRGTLEIKGKVRHVYDVTLATMLPTPVVGPADRATEVEVSEPELPLTF